VHGESETAQVIAASQALFGRGSLGELAPSTLHAALVEAGLVTAPSTATIAELFQAAGLVSSRNEARRTVAEGGAYVNNERVPDADAIVPADRLLTGSLLVLRRGKRTIAGVQLI
jgi:tyrosyl-tRNA synthetase